ncbi:hypothetical protein AMTRI_Chr03g148070 [Amborella trichopoda]
MMRAETQLSMPQDINIHTYIHTYTHTNITYTTDMQTRIQGFVSLATHSHATRSALLPPKGGVRSIAFVHSRALQLFLGAKPNSQRGAYQTLLILNRWRIICRLTARIFKER